MVCARTIYFALPLPFMHGYTLHSFLMLPSVTPPTPLPLQSPAGTALFFFGFRVSKKTLLR